MRVPRSDSPPGAGLDDAGSLGFRPHPFRRLTPILPSANPQLKRPSS